MANLLAMLPVTTGERVIIMHKDGTHNPRITCANCPPRQARSEDLSIMSERNTICTPAETHAGHLCHDQVWADSRTIGAMSTEDAAFGCTDAMRMIIECRQDT